MNRTPRISLIGTVHEEGGATTAAALLEILERIRPEVMFLEMPPDAYHAHFGYPGFFGIAPCRTLESTAEIAYCKRYDAELVLVDLPTPEAAFFDSFKDLCRRVEVISGDYCRIADEMKTGRLEGGFPFLNSERNSVLCVEHDAAILAAIPQLGDPRLMEVYESWMNQNAAREIAMLDNIYQYCEQNQFSVGAFPVGAAHRQPIMDKVRAEPRSTIEWDFSGYLDRG